MATTDFIDQTTVIEADWANDVDEHVYDQTADLHDAANITNTPSGNLTATDVQSALNELQTELDGIGGGALVSTNNLSDVDNAATARINLGVAIGSDVQAYDADTLKADTSDNLTVGYTTDIDTITYTSGDVTITPNLTLEWLKKLGATLSGNLTINEPTDGAFGGCMILVTVDGTDRSLNAGTGVDIIGTVATLDASATYEIKVVKHSDTLTTVEAVKV